MAVACTKKEDEELAKKSFSLRPWRLCGESLSALLSILGVLPQQTKQPKGGADMPLSEKKRTKIIPTSPGYPQYRPARLVGGLRPGQGYGSQYPGDPGPDLLFLTRKYPSMKYL
jgi:hypothetical protein